MVSVNRYSIAINTTTDGMVIKERPYQLLSIRMSKESNTLDITYVLMEDGASRCCTTAVCERTNIKTTTTSVVTRKIIFDAL